MKVTGKLIWLAIFILALIVPQAAFAEWYGDVQMGIGFTHVDNGGIRQNDVVTRPMESSDTSTSFGLRVGYWLESNPWLGFAGDVFLFTPNFDTPDMVDDIVLSVMPMSAFVLVRLARASSLDRAAYARYSVAARKERAGHLEGLISHAEFLKTVGEATGGTRSTRAPGFGPASTKIKLGTRSAYPPTRRKPKG